ncbi:MAG: hypothetical protein JEY79_17950 [Pseudodesulfovibrio sp.]|nr:hypothetical protein [Pseudodesulfovibrio sp.]
MKTTLNKILAYGPCGQEPDEETGELTGWLKLLKALGKIGADDKPLHIRTILDSNGLDDALWCLGAVDGYDREKRLFACACACRVLPEVEKLNPGDMRPRQAVETAALFAEGSATEDELAAAWAAARAAARDAAWAAYWDAAWAAYWATAWAAYWATAWDGELKWQEQEFRRMIECIDAGQDPYPMEGI